MNDSLYQLILGKDWFTLAKNIRDAHITNKEMAGTFCIKHGKGLFSRLILHHSHLPSAADAAETRLTIFPNGLRERWERKFNGQTFVTEQWKSADGHLVERFKEWELHFKLRVEQGNLRYEQFRAKLCLGKWRISIPRAYAPNVSAMETTDGANEIHVLVMVKLPLVGLLISYEGHLDVKGNTP